MATKVIDPVEAVKLKVHKSEAIELPLKADGPPPPRAVELPMPPLDVQFEAPVIAVNGPVAAVEPDGVVEYPPPPKPGDKMVRKFRVMKDARLSFYGNIINVKCGTIIAIEQYTRDGVKRMIESGVKLEPVDDNGKPFPPKPPVPSVTEVMDAKAARDKARMKK